MNITILYLCTEILEKLLPSYVVYFVFLVVCCRASYKHRSDPTVEHRQGQSFYQKMEYRCRADGWSRGSSRWEGGWWRSVAGRECGGNDGIARLAGIAWRLGSFWQASRETERWVAILKHREMQVSTPNKMLKEMCIMCPVRASVLSLGHKWPMWVIMLLVLTNVCRNSAHEI